MCAKNECGHQAKEKKKSQSIIYWNKLRGKMLIWKCYAARTINKMMIDCWIAV